MMTLAGLVLWLIGFPEVGKVTSRIYAGGRPLTAGAPEVEDYAIARFVLGEGTTVQLACLWRLNAGRDAVIEASLFGTRAAHPCALLEEASSISHCCTSAAHQVNAGSHPPDECDSRAASARARRLVRDQSYDPEALRFCDVARLIDRISLVAGR